MKLVESVDQWSSKLIFNQLIGPLFLEEKTYQDFLSSPIFQRAKKLHTQGLQEDRFGYKSRRGGIFGPSASKDVSNIAHFLALKKSQGARVLIHTGIGGQALGNRAQIEPTGESQGLRVYVLEKLGLDFNALFKDIARQEYKPSQILIHASSKSGTTDETMINFQMTLRFLIRGLASEWKWDRSAADGLIEKYEGCGDLSKISLHLLSLSLDEKKLLQGAFDRVVFTTTLNVQKSRIYALAKSPFVRELSEAVNGKAQELQTFPIPENVGGRFSRRSQSGLISAGFSGRDISQIQNGAEEVLSCFESDHPEVNPALKLAAAIYLSDCDFISFSVQNSSLIAVADAFRQLFPESNGKDGQGPFVVTSVGQKELDNRVSSSLNTVFFVLNIEKDQTQKSVSPLKILDSSKRAFVYQQADLSEKEEAQRDLFFEEFTVWYGLLKAAEITDQIQSPAYQKRDPQNQPFVEHGKKLMEKSAAELDRTAGALKKRYADQWKLVEKGPSLGPITLFENKIPLSEKALTEKLEWIIKNQIENKLQSISSKHPVLTDSELGEILEKIETEKVRRFLLKSFEEKKSLDEEIKNLFEKMISIGYPVQSESIEKEAKVLAALMLYALGQKKILLPVFYSAQTQAETLGEWWRWAGGCWLNDYGLGTREQHSHFQSLLDGREVVFPLLVDVISPLKEITLREEPVKSYGLAKDYLNDLYPDEVRRLYLEAEVKTFIEIAKRDVGVLCIKDVGEKKGQVEAYHLFARAVAFVRACANGC